jgi:hypothetical protein
MKEYAELKTWLATVPGVRLERPHSSGAATAILADHPRLVMRLKDSRTTREDRISVLLKLIQLEILMLGHMW